MKEKKAKEKEKKLIEDTKKLNEKLNKQIENNEKIKKEIEIKNKIEEEELKKKYENDLNKEIEKSKLTISYDYFILKLYINSLVFKNFFCKKKTKNLKNILYNFIPFSVVFYINKKNILLKNK